MNSLYHPVLFEKELAISKPKNITHFGRKLVVWKGNNNKEVNCVLDKCSHRGAKLSGGIVIDDDIECPYHGWIFDSQGKCKHIPQSQYPNHIPQACHIRETYKTFVDDGIIWIGNDASTINIPEHGEWLDNADCFVTDYPFDVDYNYFYAIENLLDPAHLHFIHDSFQGNKAYASAIAPMDLVVSDTEISARFVHANENVPQIVIRFLIPSIVDVSILNKDGETVRKNIIHVTPTADNSCKILFRDVAVKKYFAPKDNTFLTEHVNFIMDKLAKTFIEEHYQIMNTSVVSAIMQQDIDVITGQQENVPDYFSSKYVMPTESDRLIVEFRKWAFRNHIKSHNST